MNNKGFSLVELMVICGILGILLGIALPGYVAWKPRYDLKSSVRDIVNVMNLSRINAMKRHIVAVIIFNLTNDQYTAFLDTNGNWALDSNETIIKSATMPTGVDMYESTFSSHTYGFSTMGMSQSPLTGPYELHLVSSKGDYMGIEVGVAGRVKVITSSDGGVTWSAS